jgi:hypothetical protein
VTGGGVPVIANAGGDAADPDETFTVTGGTGGTGSTNSTHFNGGTDGPRRRRVPAGGVLPGRARVPGVSARGSGVILVGRIGTGGALVAAAVRESVTVARVFVAGVPGPGHWCGG